MLFSFEKEKDGKMSFLYVKILEKNGKSVTTVYRKRIFSGVYIHFESYLSSLHKFGMLYTLVCRCFTLWSDWTKLQEIVIRIHL